jgi:hypothetical protein
VSRKRLARTNASAAVPIKLADRLVWSQSARILEVVQQFAPPAIGTLLAQPEASPDGQSIDWYTTLPGTAIRLSDLSQSEQAAVTELVGARIGQVRALASLPALIGQKDLPALLNAATESPGPDFVYVVGRDPVLTMWGHRSASMAAPVAAPFPWSRLLWPTLLLAVLVALWLLWHFLSPMLWRDCPIDGSRVLFWSECPVPNEPVAIGPDPALLQQLLDELERAKRNRESLEALVKDFEEKLKACVAPPAPPEPEPEPQPEPPSPQTESEPQPAPEPVAKPTPQPAPPPAPVPEPAPAPEPPPPPVQQSQVEPPPPSFENQKCEEVIPERKPWEAPQVYFVVDGSGSMAEDAGGETRLDAAKSSIEYMAEHLPGDVITGMVNFSDCGAIVNSGTMSRDELIRATNALEPQDGTPLARSIERAGNTMSRTRKGIMIVATDGEDSCNQDPCQAARDAVAKNPNLTINVIDVGNSGVGQCIADAGGGQVYRANNASEITEAMVKASQQKMVPKKCVEAP